MYLKAAQEGGPMSGKRPRWLTTLSLTESAVGVFTFCLGAYYLDVIHGLTSSFGLSPAHFPDFYSFFGLLTAIGAVAIAIGYGLWRGKGWGWTAGTYLGVAYLVLSLGFGSYFVSVYGDYTEMQAGLAYLIVSLAAVLYLDRPGVKEFFGK